MVPQRACPSFAVSEMAIGAHPECRRSETVTLPEASRRRAVQGAGTAKRGGEYSASYRTTECGQNGRYILTQNIVGRYVRGT
jgi:hypothetical protein